MSYVSCAKHKSDLAKKQDALTDCEGNPITSPVPTCDQMTAAIAETADTKQDALKTCAGQAMPAGASVPTCTEMNTAIGNAIAAAAPDLKTCAGTAMPKGANVPTCTEMTAAINGAISAALAPSAAFTAATKVAETTTTLAVSGVNYVYTNEDGTQTVVQPGQFLSSDADNAIGIDSQGRLKVLIPAQLPDDQVLSGDNSGTVDLTLTPVIVGDQTNYVIKGDLKVAAQTPTNTPSLLKPSASGYYVSASEVVAAVGFTDCDGNAIEAGTSLATCADMTDAIAAEASARQAADTALQTTINTKQDKLPSGESGAVWTATAANPAGEWKKSSSSGGGGAYMIAYGSPNYFAGAPNTTYVLTFPANPPVNDGPTSVTVTTDGSGRATGTKPPYVIGATVHDASGTVLLGWLVPVYPDLD